MTEVTALVADISPSARASSKPRFNSTWAFVAVLVVGIFVIGHYTYWTYYARPDRLNDPDFSKEQPAKSPVAVQDLDRGRGGAQSRDAAADAEELREKDEQQHPEEPLQKEETQPAADDNRNATKPAASVNKNEERTCDSDKYAFDANGKPCIDLKTAMYRQLIYVTDRPDTQYLYCAIPKNGCTYHLALLNRIYGAQDYEFPGTIHDRDRKNVFTLYARNSETIGRMLANESLPKYIVVRNPLRRTLSAYLDKVEDFLPAEDRSVETFHEWIYAEYPKGLPADRDWQGTNPHWKPELEFCGYKVRDVRSVFKVFRVEEPKEYVDFLYKVVPEKYLKDGWRGKLNLSFRDHILGPRRRTGNTNEKFERYFNNLELFDHMSKVLEQDIEVLGYMEEVQQMREALQRNLGLL